jgi:hypothetical protein
MSEAGFNNKAPQEVAKITTRLCTLEKGERYTFHVGRDFSSCDHNVRKIVNELQKNGSITTCQRRHEKPVSALGIGTFEFIAIGLKR